MKIDWTKIELDQSDIDYFHDVIVNALGQDESRDSILQYWKELPEDIKCDALKWGMSDTQVRDQIFEWLQK